MNTGAFGENFPYSNFHDLNMDWIIKIAKDFLDQYTNIQNTIDEGLEGLDSKAQELEALLQQWYDTHSEDIANQLADALNDLNNWYATHEGYLDQYVADSIASFNQQAEQKAQQTIASIPSDYTQLSDDVNNLKSTVGNSIGVPVLETAQWVDSEYINASNGSFTPYSGWHRSQYIDIGTNNAGKVIHFNNSKNDSSAYNVFYDANHAKVGANFNTNNTDIIIPNNARYFAVSIENTYNVTWNWGIVPLIDRATNESLDNVIDKYNINSIIFDVVNDSYIDRATGSFIDYPGWKRTDYIDISNFDTVIIETIAKTEYNAFYTKDKTYINNFTISMGRNNIEIPNEAHYMALSGVNATIDAIAIYKGYPSDKTFMQDECLLLRKELPSYYTEYPATPTGYNDGAYIDMKAGEVSLANKNFIFITDVHWQSNAKNSNKLIAYLRKKLHISNVIHGGDILDYDRDNPYLATVHMREWVDEARASCGSGLLPVHGNHDINTGSGRNDSETEADKIPYTVAESIELDGSKPFIVQETNEEIESRISSITFDSEADKQEVIAYYKLHYYYDDDKNKIRYIVLNHGTHLNGIIYRYFNVRQFGEVFLQMDWLYSVLMSTPNQYTVVVAMHTFLNYNNNQMEAGPLQVCNMLIGFREKNSSLRVTNNNNIPGTVYPYGYHYYDFSNANTPRNILCLGGDMHWDFAVICYRDNNSISVVPYSNEYATQPNSILVVHTQTDAYNRTYPPGTYITDTYPMTPGTITEQCFDIVTMKDENEYTEAKFVRIGAGYDRVFKLSNAT